MKNILILIIATILCFPLQIVSQDAKTFIRELYESSSDIDTVYSEFDSFIFKNNDTVIEQQILDLLIKNKKNKKRKIRRFTADFLVEMSENCKSLRIRQESLYHAVDMHFISDYGFSCYPKEIFTDKTIELILSVLNREMTEEEYSLNYERRDTTKKFEAEIIKKKQKELNCSRQTAIDSLFKQFKRKSIESFYRLKGKNSDRFIRLFGWLGKKEYAPILENLLNDSRYKKKTIYMTLAKLEYKDYFEKTFASFPDDFKIPSYINTWEAWWKFIEVNNNLDVVVKRDMFGEKLPTTNLSRAIDFTSFFLHIHFPEEPYFFGFAEKEEDIPKLIEKTKKAYNWLKENKENLEMKEWKKFCL